MNFINLTLAHELVVRTMEDRLPVTMIPAHQMRGDCNYVQQNVNRIVDTIAARGFLTTVAIVQVNEGGDNLPWYSYVVFAFDFPEDQARELSLRFHQARIAVANVSGVTVYDVETCHPISSSATNLVRSGMTRRYSFTREFDRLMTILLGVVNEELTTTPLIRTIVVPARYVNTVPFNEPQSFFPFSDALKREEMPVKEAVR